MAYLKCSLAYWLYTHTLRHGYGVYRGSVMRRNALWTVLRRAYFMTVISGILYGTCVL